VQLDAVQQQGRKGGPVDADAVHGHGFAPDAAGMTVCSVLGGTTTALPAASQDSRQRVGSRDKSQGPTIATQAASRARQQTAAMISRPLICRSSARAA
jgi:hypothetical protein